MVSRFFFIFLLQKFLVVGRMILSLKNKKAVFHSFTIFVLVVLLTNCRESNQVDLRDEALDLKYSLARKNWVKGDNKIALFILDSLIEKSKSFKNFELLGKSYFLRGYVYRAMEESTKELQSFLKSRRAYQKTDNLEAHSNICATIAIYLISHHKTYGASIFVKESLKFALEAGSQKLMANAYFNYGWWLRKQDQYDSAFYYYQLAKPIEKNLGRSLRLADIYLEEGHIYSELGAYDLAEERFRLVMPLARELKYTDLMAKCYNNLGFCLLQDENYDVAIEYFELALEYFTKDDPHIAATYNNLGKAYLKRKKVFEAVTAFKHSLNYQNQDESYISKELIISFHELQKYYAGIGNLDSMLHYSDLQNSITRTVLLHRREIDLDVMRANIDEILASDLSDRG